MARSLRIGFNEAGADCPGMPNTRRSRAWKAKGFNEAGADCPGMPIPASAACAAVNASMRPGQTAPECAAFPQQQQLGKPSFNEAGADCPGMPRTRAASFSEPCALQ